jgi:putative tryptophan/tyrosine transport system ATP-binding protein
MSILHLEHITLRYPNTTQPVLNDLSYTVKRNDFVILLGSNGSGKSSLLKLIHRHHQPTSGEITFLDKPVQYYSADAFSKKVAVLSQNTSDSLFTALTVYENYLLVKQHQSFFAFLHHTTERKQLQDYLYTFNPNLSDKLDAPVFQLSGGEKQALALALCLLHPPKLLLLDEHTSALDPKTSEQIMALTQRMISEHHITCILTTHDLDIALRYGNRVLVLHEGKIRKVFEEQDRQNLTKEMLISSYY